MNSLFNFSRDLLKLAEKKDYVEDILDEVENENDRMYDSKEELDEFNRKQNVTSLEELTRLEEENQALLEQIESFKERFELSEAEKANITRITNADIDKAKDFPIKKFANEVFNVMDTLDLCIENIPAQKLDVEEILTARDGLLKVKDSFKKMMEQNYQVTQIETVVGDKFDPDLHDAIFEMAHGSHNEPNSVGAILKSGWIRKGILVRAVHVGVVIGKR